MSDLIIDGGIPLMGNVVVSGAKNSAIKLIYASLFSNEQIILENVPQIEFIESDVEVIKSLGATAEWIGPSRLLINASTVNLFEIPHEFGSVYRSSYLAVPALLFRFGKAIVPKINYSISSKISPLTNFFETWKSFGVEIEEETERYILKAANLKSTEFTFKIPSHMGTDNAILMASFIAGDTKLNNVSEESEIDDLIEFLNLIGPKIIRTEPKKLSISGANIFKGAVFKVQGDKSEAATFAIAAVLTKGNIVIEGVEKLSLVSFTSFLSKIGARFEYLGNDLKIWRNSEILEPLNLTIAPSPGFVEDWQPLSVLALTQADGESLVHDTVYTNRFSYLKELNMMGANLELLKPSIKGLIASTIDESYDMVSQGEPDTLIRVVGPTRLRPSKLDIPDTRYGAVLALAAICANGKSTISGWYNVEKVYENFFEKLHNLGARIQAE